MSRIVKRNTTREPQRPTDPVGAFDFDHGSDYVIHQCRVYYPDGAWRESSQPGGMAEPSNDPLERAKMIVFFWSLKTQRAERDFSSKKHRLSQNYGTPSQSDLESLKELRAQVIDARKHLDEALETQVELRNTPQVNQWTRWIKEHQPELNAAKEALEETDETDTESIDILENKIRSLESKLCTACINLERNGYAVEPDLEYLLEEDRRRQQEVRDEERQRNKELANIEI